jgi:hypothetical protein
MAVKKDFPVLLGLKKGVQSLSQTVIKGKSGEMGGHLAQSIDRELRGLRRAGRRLEKATKEWGEAHRLYAAALNELTQRTNPQKRSTLLGRSVPPAAIR